MSYMQSVCLNMSIPPKVVQIGLNQHGRMTAEKFRMRNVYGLHLYNYRGWFEIDGVRHDFSPGSISITPPDVNLVWHFPRRATHHYAHLRFSEGTGGQSVNLPVITSCSQPAEREAMRLAFDRALASYRIQPARSAAIIWDMLWRLVPDQDHHGHGQCPAAGIVAGSGDRLHPAMHTLLALIEDRLDAQHDLSDLAAQVSLSKTHLIRLFNRHCGMTVMQWIRRRRLERARDLLRTGSMSIQSVAAAVGIPDPHRFNKLVRNQWGISPSQLRKGLPSDVKI